MNDLELRLAAFERVRILENVFGDDIPWAAISDGFKVDNEKVYLANKAVGIFKPQQLNKGILSIKTTKPRVGRENIYLDKQDEDGSFVYSLQGDDPNNHFNQGLKQNYEEKIPLIYFHAVSPGIYKVIYPCFVDEIDDEKMLCRVTVGTKNTTESSKKEETIFVYPTQIEKRYAIRETKARLHQASFREVVLDAYGNKCAMSSLPVRELLEAAHIMPDCHDQGVAEVTNGICLSKIHHRAYDANLISIDENYKIHVSQKLLGIADGPVLEQGIKALNGSVIKVPEAKNMQPSREFLGMRHNEFLEWNFA